jgi:flagellar protein FliS
MTMRSHRAYAATQRETGVSSARPIDLVVMVYARLLDHLRSAQFQMAEGTDASESLTKAVELITTGLEACLDKAQGGEIAENLAVIYDWANREIMLSRLRRDSEKLQGVINALQPLSEAWREHAGLTNDLVEAANQPLNMAGAETRSVSSAMAA